MTKEDEDSIRSLYNTLIHSWNKNDARSFAANFVAGGKCIGFDGSEYDGPAEAEEQLGAIFKDHTVATYVSKIREVKSIASDVAVLEAVASMVPPGGNDINPDRNVIHTLVAVKKADSWQIALYQNTPAKYDGQPEKTQALTDELRELLAN